MDSPKFYKGVDALQKSKNTLWTSTRLLQASQKSKRTLRSSRRLLHALLKSKPNLRNTTRLLHALWNSRRNLRSSTRLLHALWKLNGQASYTLCGCQNRLSTHLELYQIWKCVHRMSTIVTKNSGCHNGTTKRLQTSQILSGYQNAYPECLPSSNSFLEWQNACTELLHSFSGSQNQRISSWNSFSGSYNVCTERLPSPQSLSGCQNASTDVYVPHPSFPDNKTCNQDICHPLIALPEVKMRVQNA